MKNEIGKIIIGISILILIALDAILINQYLYYDNPVFFYLSLIPMAIIVVIISLSFKINYKLGYKVERAFMKAFGYKYILNRSTDVIHDIDSENANCQLDEIRHISYLFESDKNWELEHISKECEFCMKNKTIKN